MFSLLWLSNYYLITMRWDNAFLFYFIFFLLVSPPHILSQWHVHSQLPIVCDTDPTACFGMDPRMVWACHLKYVKKYMERWGRTDGTHAKAAQRRGRCCRHAAGSKGDWAHVIDMQQGEDGIKGMLEIPTTPVTKNRLWLTNNDVLMWFIICSRAHFCFSAQIQQYADNKLEPEGQSQCF